MGVTRAAYGRLPDGAIVDVIELDTPGGLRMRVLTLGAIIQSLFVPDACGKYSDVVLGHDQLEGYLGPSLYFGAVVGRCANRIAKGRFTLEGIAYQLSTNDGPNHLHGGLRGFDRVVWEARAGGSASEPAIVLHYTSAEGEEGYPGRLDARVTYTLSDEEGLAIDYDATSNRPTIANLTQHSYWNLGGPDRASVLDHELTIAAELFTPVDVALIPEGEHRRVAGTPFDFRAPTPVGARIDSHDEQLSRGRGYDHNFVLGAPERDGMRLAATLRDRESGRVMTVSTTEPGLQFYSGNFLNGTIRGKGGRVCGHRAAVCLETQHFPNSPNRPDFPSVVLQPHNIYRSRTIYLFTTDASRQSGNAARKATLGK